MIDRRAFFWTPTVLWLASSALAEPASPPGLSVGDQALVDKATAYLQALTCAEGRFVQSDASGREVAGTFWLQRPGRARFDYDPPSGLAIASDGRLVSVVNHRLKTIQSYPLGLTPLSIFLSRDIRLDRDVVVRKVDANATTFTLVAAERRARDRGFIALSFAREPLALAGWSLTDARGQTVRVRLTRLARAAPRPKAFFDIYDPSLHGPRPDAPDAPQ